MEKYHDEIVQTLVETYSDDKQLLGDILYYLYKSSADMSLNASIVEVMNDLNRCCQCGGELVVYTFSEAHTELDNNNTEQFFAQLCRNCDRAEIEQLHTKERV